MNQPHSGLFKQIVLALLILMTLSGCRLVSIINQASSTPTQTQTSTPENCSFNWAYGDGSADFDNIITQKLDDEGIFATVKSTSYGEINSCGNTYGAMALDVKVDVKVADFTNHISLVTTSEKVLALLKENLSISNVNNLGNVNLTFSTPDNSVCYWNASLNQCAE